MVRKNPAISHQPPWFNGGMCKPQDGEGGSSANHGSWRTNWIGDQFTDAHMFSPMISMAKKPKIREAMPVPPR